MTVAVVGRLGAWQSATIAAANPGRVAVASVTPALAVAPVGRLGQWQQDLFARSPWSPVPAMPSYIPSAPAPIPAPPVAPPPPVAAPPAPPPPPPPAPPVAPAPSPVAPAPVPVAPAPAPVAPAPATPAAGPLATALADVRAGARFRLADGTKVKGYSVSGSASVQSFDGKTLTLRLDASAAFGFVQKKIALKVEDLGNGKMKVVANELNGQGQTKEQLYAGTLEVVSSSKGRLTLRTPEGEQGSLVVRPDGGLELASPLGTFVMAAA